MDTALEHAPPQSFAESFGARLAAIRRERDLTQEQLGEGVGLGKAGVSSWEVGRTKPDVEQCAQLCRFLKVSADRLLGLSQE
jgi:transcriptional regulator with XRE-family HTH domain